jgi:hypothetical protein
MAIAPPTLPTGDCEDRWIGDRPAGGEKAAECHDDVGGDGRTKFSVAATAPRMR